MNLLGVLLTIVAVGLIFGLPRRLAAIAIFFAAAYVTRGQVLEVGGAHLTVLRILVICGALRVAMRGERMAGGFNAIDRWMIAWSIVLMLSSALHTSDAWMYRAGLVLDLGSYFLMRVFIADCDDVVALFKAVCVILVPVAIVMSYEKATAYNLFGVLLGGVNETSLIREGHIRASGPFAHPILAGAAAATTFAMSCFLWRRERTSALLGLFASLAIVFDCTSSGPIMMIAFMLLGFALWIVRDRIRAVLWLAVSAILLLSVVMNDPVYFLIARVDISGGSQGYFRAQLIRSSIEHLDEWWLAGTDHTRHWMASGIYATDRHTDITNHILAMGVMGGLLLMIVFVAILIVAFRTVGRVLRRSRFERSESVFLAWTLGVVLFGHVMNFLSISLFDQSILFFYVVLAAIGAIAADEGPAAAAAPGRRLPVRGIDVRQFATRTDPPPGDVFGRHRAA